MKMQRRAFSTKAEKAGDRTIRFVISDSGLDRDGDTIDVNGWQLENYRRNPVMLWAHDHATPPIARATDIGVRGGKLVAVAEFAETAFASEILGLYKTGFLHATSVGFRPVKWTPRKDGFDFSQVELIEFSAVPVPSNPRALVAAAGAASHVKAWARKVLADDDDAVIEIVDVDDSDLVEFDPKDLAVAVASASMAAVEGSIAAGIDRALSYRLGRVGGGGGRARRDFTGGFRR